MKRIGSILMTITFLVGMVFPSLSVRAADPSVPTMKDTEVYIVGERFE